MSIVTLHRLGRDGRRRSRVATRGRDPRDPCSLPSGANASTRSRRVNRIIARFDGSQPVQNGHPGRRRRHRPRVRDHPRLDVPADRRRAGCRWSASPAIPHPFHEIDIGVGIIGRAAATPADPVRRRRPQPTPTTAPHGTTSGARSPRRSSTATSCSAVVNFEGTLERPIGPAQVALAEMVVHVAVGGAPLGQARRRAARPAARDRTRAGREPVARGRPRPSRGSSPRSWTPSPTCWRPIVVGACSPAGSTACTELEAGVGVPDGAIGSAAPPGSVSARALRRRTGAGRRTRRMLAAWPIVVGRSGAPEGARRTSAMALPIEVGRRHGSRPARQPRSDADARRTRELERGIADLLTAQIAIALQNADLHARVAESAVRDPLTGPAQPALLRRGGRDGPRQRPTRRAPT